MADEKTVSETRENKSEYYDPAIERIRIILMFFMCIYLFGLPTAVGEMVKIFCGFVPIAFFIISGYLVLRESENRSARILRAIKRTAVAFGISAAVYFVLSMLYYALAGIDIFSVLGTAFMSKRFWFNFVFMNVWQFDIGTAIWYIQSLLYAYIIIYFLDKYKLLKYDWIIASVFIFISVIFGELAGVFKWNILGYTYLPGNFFTRALPYILLGGFVKRKIHIFRNIHRWCYRVGIVAGIVLMGGEMMLLAYLNVQGYYGHLLGMPIVALSVCLLAFCGDPNPGFEAELGMSRRHVNLIYYICQPIYAVLVLLLAIVSESLASELVDITGIITFVVSLFIAWSAAFLKEISERISREK